jgi:lysophospholipase L1-like esterase
LRRGPCTIAYLGASVTAQRDGYRPRLHEAVCRETGHPHTSVAAGIGSVGSISGVFLMDDLVLRHRPDLCLIEFSITDMAGKTPPEAVEPAVEGIVLKLRDADCQACLVHLYRPGAPVDGDHPVLAAYERVAERHGVPVVDVAGALGERLRAGELGPDDVLRDFVHTTPGGSALVAEAVARGLREIADAAPEQRSTPAGAPHPDSFRHARVAPVGPDMVADPARASVARFRLVSEYVEIAVGNRFECVFDGELVGLVVIVGPSSGIVRVSAGGDVQDLLLWDEDCHYDRLSTGVLPRRCPAGTPVTIEPTDAAVDTSNARRPVEPTEKRLRVVGFMVRA